MSPFRDPKILRTVGIGGAIALMLTAWLTTQVSADIRMLKEQQNAMQLTLQESVKNQERAFALMGDFVSATQHTQEAQLQIARQTCINTAKTKQDAVPCTR
jgi:hypothetical protein